jgi:acyl carrier protein
MSGAGDHDSAPRDCLMVLFDHAQAGRAPDRDRATPERYSKIHSSKSNEHWLWEGYSVSTIVEEKVIGIVSEQLGVPKEEVKLDSSIIEDLKADSLDVVELVMELEDEFDITIPDDDYEKLKTVGDAIKYIDEKK